MTGATSRSRVFPARLSALAEVAAFVAEAGAAAGIARGLCLKLALLVEELFTNTVLHGHRRESDEPVRVGLDVQSGRVTLTYEDTAPAHDPFVAAARPDGTATVEDWPVGGLGVHLVASLATEVEYLREGDRNRIRLVVAVPP